MPPRQEARPVIGNRDIDANPQYFLSPSSAPCSLWNLNPSKSFVYGCAPEAPFPDEQRLVSLNKALLVTASFTLP